MRVKNIVFTMLVAGAIALPCTIAEAKGPKGPKGNGPPAFSGATQNSRNDWNRPPGWDKGEKKGWRNAETPPWSQRGQRRGWRDERLPPGLQRRN